MSLRTHLGIIYALLIVAMVSQAGLAMWIDANDSELRAIRTARNAAATATRELETRVTASEGRTAVLDRKLQELADAFNAHVHAAGQRRGVGEQGPVTAVSGPGVDIWMPQSTDEQDPDPELRPMSEKEFREFQTQLREYERRRPRIVTHATEADIQNTLALWGRELFERDMGLSIVDGKGLPVHVKITGLLTLEDRVRDAEFEIQELAEQVGKLTAESPR